MTAANQTKPQGWLTRKRKELVARFATLVLVGHVMNCQTCKGSDYKVLCDTGWMLEQNAKVAGAAFRASLGESAT